jgi:hypothetical protein
MYFLSDSLRYLVCKIWKDDVFFSTHFGLDSQPLLERRDGTDFSWSSVLGKDDICECDRGMKLVKYFAFVFFLINIHFINVIIV